MPRLHENSEFDVEREAHDFVARLEREVLDEPQLVDAVEKYVTILQSRQQAAIESLRAAHDARIEDNRRALLKAKVKGIKPLLPGGGMVKVPEGVIPNLRAVR